MARVRTVNFDLPRNLNRDKSGNLRYKRPDTFRYVSLHGHTLDVAIRMAETMNAAFGPKPLRGHRYRYTESFVAFDWSTVDRTLLQIIAAKFPEVFDVHLQIRRRG